MKTQKKKGPCWKGYTAVGMKMKGGRKVPNCVPVSESVERILNELHVKKAQRTATALSKKLPPASDTSSPASLLRLQHRAALQRVETAKKKRAARLAAKGMTPEDAEAKGKAARREKGIEDSIQRIGNLITEVAAWQKKAGKNPSGGLNKKGVESYRRENPGSKLKTAVTTKPSKLKKGSKAAKRRKSFCARMGGMKKRRTSAKTAKNPNSRINKALRKWNC